MAESDNEKQAKLTIPASSAPAAKKKTKPAGVKKGKRGARLAGPNKLEEEGQEATIEAYHGDNDKIEEGAIEDDMDPSRPVQILEKFDLEKMQKLARLRSEWLAKSKTNDIIIQDPTSEWVRDAFLEKTPRLRTILEKDSVRCFLRFFSRNKNGMIWDHSITSQTLTYMVSVDALRCAKVALEGKEPELNWRRANPNCINPFGYFPLHEAAEKFSVDMIKLLFRHGASANVRTVGDMVAEDLLPLHVAVENACLHKYLEDNLLPSQEPQDYMYNLIRLLCLPDMKIFLDTIRLLAKETDNLVDELWNYIKDKKLLQTVILLLAAHEKIRGDSSSKRNVNGKQNGFPIIMNRIVEQLSSRNTKGEDMNTQEQLEERMSLGETFRLVNIIYEAGGDLNNYIQAHSEVSHVDVLEHVSSILKDHGFCPTGEGIDVTNLHPYACKMFTKELGGKGNVDAAKSQKCLVVLGKRSLIFFKFQLRQALRKKRPRGWDPDYSRRMFFPYWRSVLVAKYRVKVYPHYAPEIIRPEINFGELLNPRRGLTAKQSSKKPNVNHSWLGRLQQPRTFSTAAFTLLKKVLRK